MKKTIGIFAALLAFTTLGAITGAGAATISGTVDSGGTVRAAGLPLEGAKVVLISPATGGGAGTAAKRLDSTTTDAKGLYTFTKVDSGVKQIQAGLTGYQNGTATILVRSDTASYTSNIHLAVLPKPGSIKGTVHSGTETGDPVAGALVVITRNGGGGRSDSAVTGADGKYAFDSVAAATYAVRVTATGFNNGNANATVGSGAAITSNIVLLPAGASGKIIGTVTKASGGSALEGATVILSRNAGATRVADTVKTDAKGKYGYDSVGVATGYTVTVKDSGYVTGTVNGLNVVFGKTDTANFVLLPVGATGKITGVVSMASDGSPLEGATVILTRNGGGARVADTVKTDVKGMYGYDSVAVALGYTVTVKDSGYLTGTETNIDVAFGKIDTVDFSLLPVGASGKIAGAVSKASDGSALEGAVVILTRNGGGARVADTVKTDAKGMYSYDSVAIGTGYTLTVSASGLLTSVQTGIAVVFAKTTTADFALLGTPADTTHGAVTGVVQDSQHKPLAKARVILARTGIGAAAVADTMETDADGAFTFPSVAEGNNYRLTVTLSTYSTATRTGLNIVAGESIVANFTLEQPTSIRASFAAASGMRMIYSGNQLRLSIPEAAVSGSIRIYAATGAMSFSANVPAHASQLVIPMGKTGGYMVLKRGARIERMALPIVR